MLCQEPEGDEGMWEEVNIVTLFQSFSLSEERLLEKNISAYILSETKFRKHYTQSVVFGLTSHQNDSCKIYSIDQKKHQMIN